MISMLSTDAAPLQTRKSSSSDQNHCAWHFPMKMKWQHSIQRRIKRKYGNSMRFLIFHLLRTQFTRMCQLWWCLCWTDITCAYSRMGRLDQVLLLFVRTYSFFLICFPFIRCSSFLSKSYRILISFLSHWYLLRFLSPYHIIFIKVESQIIAPSFSSL